MARIATNPTQRRRTSRPQLAGRDAFDAALAQVGQLPPKTPREDIAAEYLPRFVAKLRELHYTQDDIVHTIVGMQLGLTERQIRGADSAWTRQHGKPATASTAGRARAAGGAASGGDPAAGTGGHAGLAGARALTR